MFSSNRENKMKKLEELAPISYIEALNKRKEDLEKILKQKKAFLEQNKHLENQGHIRIVPHYHKLQFFLITKKGDKKGKYLARKENPLALALVEYDYVKKIVTAMENELKHINKLIKIANNKSVETVYKKFSPSRRTLITPVTLTDDEYIAAWKNQQYKGNSYDFGTTEYYTIKGERVRSKSEVIIANILTQNHIPYKYEAPLQLKNNRTIYPDFCCLNPRTRKEIFWEHFGLMEDAEYSARTLQKIQEISESGLEYGKDYIFTYEKEETPLNIRQIEKTIQKYVV